MLKLNKCEIDFDRLFKRAPIVLEKRTPQILDTSIDLEVRQQALFVVTNKYIDLAYANYALENFSEVKPNLKKAAPFAYLRGFEKGLRTYSTAWSILDDLNIVLLFGDSELKVKLQALSWSLPDDRIDDQDRAIYLYDHLLIKIGTGQIPEKADIDAALLEAKSTKNKDVLQFFLPLIEAISALVSGDKALWQASIDKAIKWHTDECKFGDYKDMEAGFICLNALTMAKLGQDLHHWQCKTQSLYLPLFLIEEES